MNSFKHYSLTLLFALISTISAQAYDFEVDGIYYNITSSTDLTCEVTTQMPWVGSYSGDITIPSTVFFEGKTYNVTGIGDYAFTLCTSMTSVTIPNSVTSIGMLALAYCSNLKSVTIPSSVTSIGNNAFQDCSSLTYIAIPNSVKSIGERAFSACSELQEINVANDNPSYTSVDGVLFDIEKTELIVFPARHKAMEYIIPNSVTNVGDYAFYCCSGLKYVIIPNSVTKIGDYAFFECSSLTSITIPKSVTSIGSAALNSCGFQSISVANDNPSYTSVDGVLFNKEETELIAFPPGNSTTNYTIPNSVTSIGSWAFYNCSGLTSISIPNGVTYIGDYAFSCCSSLTSVIIPDGVTSIGVFVFYGCSGLKSAIIPNSVTSIGDDVFGFCSALTSITIPNGVTSIGDDAFLECRGLTKITCLNFTPPSISYWGAFNGVDMFACVLEVPEGSVEAYRNAEVWKEFVNIVGIDVSGIDRATIYADDNINIPAYNLQGVEVKKDYKGIVIRNGKKFLKK
ncbi:MAG: leucine-rich repeat domain-containing protein [Bacteroidaceae bacterium]|nr:leucine-rich repeat domain-containing protein [Bacteroidaceae bacterium]